MLLQVKINSRGLVYSVVLLLGSVALTVSFYIKKKKSLMFHYMGPTRPLCVSETPLSSPLAVRGIEIQIPQTQSVLIMLETALVGVLGG